MIDVCIVMIQKFKDYIYEQHCKGKHLDAEKVFRDLKATKQYFQWAGYESEEKTFLGYIEHLEKENKMYIDDNMYKDSETKEWAWNANEEHQKYKAEKEKNEKLKKENEDARKVFMKLIKDVEKLKSGTTENDTELEIEHFRQLPFIKKKR